MPFTYDSIAALPNGAYFVRADLHVHSCFSYDVSVANEMSPEAIVEAAVANNIAILAITDHNNIDGIQRAMDRAKNFKDKLLYIPAVEFTTPEGHLLAYFDPADFAKLKRLLHTLDIISDEQGSRVQSSIISVIRAAHALGGICFAAHIDTKAGFETGNPGFPAWKKDLLLEPGLLGLEFRDANNSNWYSLNEPAGSNDANVRRQYAQARVTAGIPPHGALARLHSSDAHAMAEFAPPTDLTRIKITNLTFAAFRAAVADPEARVRIDSLLPKRVPHIVGLGIDGGFLDNTSIRFSSNLNVFFGGRGTGKSTALRAIAFALGIESFDAGDPPFTSVSLFCEDAAGLEYRFDRTAAGDVVGRLRKEGEIIPVNPNAFPIEYYGQGVLGDVAQRSLSDSRALQEFLDSHIAFDNLADLEAATVVAAQELSRQLGPLVEMLRSRDRLADELEQLEKRLKASEGTKIKQVAEFQNRLTSEKTLVANMSDLAQQYRRGIAFRNLIREPKQMRALSRIAAYLTGTSDAFSRAEALIDATNDILVKKSREINKTLQDASDSLDRCFQEIRAQHLKSEEQVQRYVDELKDKGLAASIAELNDLSKRKGALVAQIAKIDSQRAHHDDLRMQYDDLLGKLRDCRAQMDALRATQRSELNAGFNRDESGPLQVLLIPSERIDSPEYECFLADRLEGSYFQGESLSKVIASISPTALADLLDAMDLAKLSEIEVIGPKWAPHFSERLGKPADTLLLRTLRWSKAPRFKVLDRFSKREVPFSHLSDGQQHTVMLTIALLAGSRFPLVIDQPEDDLDNKFIAEHVVKTLREVKEQRQVILVTHNANIAVLGDSEQLLAMAHRDGEGTIASRGSIDDTLTRSAVQDCLEGGAEAFRMRMQIYGIT